MRRIRLLKQADQEFQDAQQYYRQCQSGLGDQFAAAVDEKLRSIAERPEMYAVTYSNVREAIVARFPYAIYFTDTKDTIDVWAIFHHSRDPVVWQARLTD